MKKKGYISNSFVTWAKRRNIPVTYKTVVLVPYYDGYKNVLTQDMINEEKIKYVIKHDYWLNGETITVPENSILEFDGGTLHDGTIIGQNTFINDIGGLGLWKLFAEDIIREGTWRTNGGGSFEQVQSDWNQTNTTRPDFIKNKPKLANVATSGSYNDLNNRPIIPEEVTVDTALSKTSTNPVQNKVIAKALENAGGNPDKPYDPTKHSGLGRKTLELKEGGSNILTQEDFNNANTIYVVQYDFDLDGATIQVPEGSVLNFEGGTLKNGTIIGQDTVYINVCDIDIWGENLTRKGTWREHSGGVEKFVIEDLVAGVRTNADGKISYHSEPTNISSKKLYRLVGIDTILVDFVEPITLIKWVWYNSNGIYIGNDYYTNAKSIKVPNDARNGYVGFTTGGDLTKKQVFDSIISCNIFDCDSIDSSELDRIQDSCKTVCPTFTRYASTSLEDCHCTIGPSIDEPNAWYKQDGSIPPNKILFLRGLNPFKIRIENYLNYPVYYGFTPGSPQAGTTALFTTENKIRILRNPIYDVDEKHYDTGQAYAVDELIQDNSVCLWIGNGGYGIAEGVYVSVYGNNNIKQLQEDVNNIHERSNYLRHLSQTECHCMHWNIGHYSAVGAFASDIITKEVYEKKFAEINRIIDTYSTGPKGVYTFNEFSDIAGKYNDDSQNVIVKSTSLFPAFDNWFNLPTNRWVYNAIASKFAFLTDVVFHRFPESIVPHEETDYSKSASYRRGMSYFDDYYFVTGGLYLSEQYIRFINVHLPFKEGTNMTENCLRHIIENYDSGYVVIVGDFNMQSAAIENILEDYPMYVRYNNNEPTEINIETLEAKVLDHVITKRVSVSNFTVGTYREKESNEEYSDFMVSDHCPIFFTLSIPDKYGNNVVIRKNDLQNIVIGSGTRLQRGNIARNPFIGYCYFDTDIRKPTFWSGDITAGDAGWVDFNGKNPYAIETIYKDELVSCGATIVNSTSKWETDSPNRYYGAAIDVERYAGLRCTITPDQNGTSFAFVTDTSFVGNEDVHYATGYNSLQRITDETTVNIPSDAKRLFVIMRSGDVFYSPIKIEIKDLNQ